MGKFSKKYQSFADKHHDKIEKFKSVCQKIGRVLRLTGIWAYRLRSVILAIPVAIAAVILALRNMSALPEQVDLSLFVYMSESLMIGREFVIFIPLALTALSLLLMFCSRRILYTWLISLFSLVLPVVIYIVGTFPG